MIIGIDLDSVTRNIISPTLKWWQERTGIRRYKEDIDRWSIYECLNGCSTGLFPQEFYRLWFNESRIWQHALPVLGAISAITKLHKLHDIAIITDQPTYNQKVWALEWINKHLCDKYESLVFTSRKSLVRVDILIDDGPHNFEGFTGKAILFSQPWNQKDDIHTRIYGWDDPTLFDSLGNVKRD